MDASAFLWPAGLITAGAFIGFLVGMTGVGAGSLTTPLLITVFNVNASVAVGTDLIFAALTKSTAAWSFQKHKYIDWRVFRLLAAGSLPGALAALAWLHFAHPSTDMLSILICRALSVILLASAVANFIYPLLIEKSRSTAAATAAVPARSLGHSIATAVLGALLGVLVVLTSVGAGAIGVAALMLLYPRLSPRRLIGTDVVHAIPLTLVAGAGHLALGSINLPVLGLLLVGSIPGIAAGIRMTRAVPEWLVRGALGAVLLLAAAMLLRRTI